MLLSEACDVIGDTRRGDYVVCSPDAGVAAVVGRPGPAPVRAAAARPGIADVLCPEDVAPGVIAALSDWRARPAIIHTLAHGAPRESAPAAAHVRLVGARDVLPLGHVPAALREEFERARRHSPFVAAFAKGLAVSFAYVPWQTETLCDLSIDTLRGYRRRGLAAAAAGRLIEHVLGLGKQPVWGALADNHGSLALARRLGFTPVDRLIVLSRPAEGG